MKIGISFLASVALFVLFTAIITTAQTQETLGITIDQLDNQTFPEMEMTVTVVENGITPPGLNAANFAVFEDGSTVNILDTVTENSSSQGLALTLLFDFDPNGDTALFRPMQEWGQNLLNTINLGQPNDKISHMVEVRGASGKVFTPYTTDIVAAKNGIRQLLIEDMTTRQLNQTLLEVLSADTLQRQQVIVVIGSGGDNLTLNSVIDRAIQKGAVIYTIAYSDIADSTYMATLADNTRGQYFNAPQNIAYETVRNALFSNFNSHYTLTYRSRLLQTDQDPHSVAVTVNLNGQQSQTSTNFDFPPASLSPKFNSLPLLWAWSAILGITILLLIVNLYWLA